MNKKLKAPWFNRHPALLKDVEQALSPYHWLHLQLNDDVARITGTFPIEGDGYNIEILFPKDYPDSLPVVRETGGRIPRTCDRHINPKDETACICIPDEWFVQRPDESFSTFLRVPVYNYFLSQKYFEVHGAWPFGERDHGGDGFLNFYQECFETQDRQVINNYLKTVLKKEIKGHWDCPCGNGKRIRNCHQEKIMQLRKKLPPNIALRAMKYLHGVQ